MNYELSKKLKEAGFPQKGKGIVSFDGKSTINGDYGLSFIYYPTLSELIEACRDNIKNIHHCIGCGEYEWEINHIYDDDSDYNDFAGTSDAHARTLEEAVANLWLSLNKKY